jgi:hypothetical protein
MDDVTGVCDCDDDNERESHAFAPHTVPTDGAADFKTSQRIGSCDSASSDRT